MSTTLTPAGADVQGPDGPGGSGSGGPDGPYGPGGPGGRFPGPNGPAEQRAALLRLALIVGVGVVVAAAFGVLRTLAVVAAIVVMIMLHELGHFATAKWSGMKVSEYFLGFGPRLWSVRWGETEYGVKAIPAGGYVRILGMTNLEQVDPAEESRTYRSATFPRRLMVVSAGSFMHFLIAFVLLFVLLAVVGAPNDNSTTIGSLTRFPGTSTPAQMAGLHLGDRITALDGHPESSFSDLRNFIVSHADEPVTVTFLRSGRTLTTTVTPVNLATAKVSGVDVSVPKGTTSYGFVGIGPAVVGQRVNPISAIGQAGDDFGSTVTSVFSALGQVFSSQGLDAYTSQITGHVTAKQAAGQPRFTSVVGIVYLAHDAAASGLRDVLGLLIELNIFIGVFNLAPLLPLDGGHVVTAIYERIRSRRGRRYRADMAKWAPVTAVVLVALIVIGLASIWADIFHPPANPFQ